MKNLTIGKKLASSFAILVSLLILISGFATYEMKQVTREFTEVVDVFTVLDENTMAMEINLLTARSLEKEFVASKDEKLVQQMIETMEEFNSHLETLKSTAAEAHFAVPEADEIAAAANTYNQAVLVVLGEIEAQGDKSSGIRGALRKEAHHMEEVMKETGHAELLVQYLTLRRHEKDFILREDKKYLGKANEVAGNIKNVLAELHIDDAHAGKIIGHTDNYLEYFKKFTESVTVVHDQHAIMEKAAHDIENNAHSLENRVVSLSEKESDHAKKTAAFTNIFILVLSSASVIIGIFAAFFSTRSITKPLSRAINSIDQGAVQVNEASDQVAESSNVLAEGTSEQAASLEETSASLEEISSMTSQNAGNAQEVNTMMAETKITVERSSQSMQQLTVSMQDIAQASEETQKIIKTIDDIAFQTNLLSLNAAVEAARAGEAGAGFAVVADEVRNLAMRASEAAKDTNVLIENSVTKIQEGSELVNRCNGDFGEVATNAQKVAVLVDEIATAANEQSQGISQISTAVNEMDKVTQSNAANAEESAAAAEELDSLSSRLQQTVVELQQMIGGQVKQTPPAAIKQQENIPVTQERQKASTVNRSVNNKRKTAQELIPLDDTDAEFFEDFAHTAA